MADTKNILIVDDDILVHTISERLITLLDYGVNLYGAFNGREAIAFLNECCDDLSRMPQIVLLDFEMPEMNGLEFLQRLETVRCLQRDSITLAMISNTMNNNDVCRAKALGVNHFFSKPLSKEILLEIFK